MHLPAKPALKKHPKKPKVSAPVSSWEKYDTAVKAVDKHNADKLKAWHKKCSDIKAAAHKKAALIKKHSK